MTDKTRWWGYRETENLTLPVGVKNDASTLENWLFLRKLNYRSPSWLSNWFLGISPREMKAGGHGTACSRMLTAALFVMAKRRKDSQRPSTGECPDECGYPCPGVLASRERTELLTEVISWMNLTDIMLSERARHTKECLQCDSTDMNE